MTRDGKAAEAEPLLRESLELAKANHLEGTALPEKFPLRSASARLTRNATRIPNPYSWLATPPRKNGWANTIR